MPRVYSMPRTRRRLATSWQKLRRQVLEYPRVVGVPSLCCAECDESTSDGMLGSQGKLEYRTLSHQVRLGLLAWHSAQRREWSGILQQIWRRQTLDLKKSLEWVPQLKTNGFTDTTEQLSKSCCDGHVVGYEVVSEYMGYTVKELTRNRSQQ